MIHRRFFLLAIVMVVGMVTAVTAYAFIPKGIGMDAPDFNEDVMYEEIDIELISDIDGEMLTMMDADRDGNVSLAEWTQVGGADILFQISDVNRDNSLTIDDLNTFSAIIENKDKDETLMAYCIWVWIRGFYYPVCF